MTGAQAPIVAVDAHDPQAVTGLDLADRACQAGVDPGLLQTMGHIVGHFRPCHPREGSIPAIRKRVLAAKSAHLISGFQQHRHKSQPRQPDRARDTSRPCSNDDGVMNFVDFHSVNPVLRFPSSHAAQQPWNHYNPSTLNT